MVEQYFLFFFRRAIALLGRIYNDPKKLAIFCLLLVVSFILSLREFRKERDEGPIWGKIFSNTLWLSLGLGLPIAGLAGGASLVMRTLGMSRPGRALLALARYVLFPFKMHLVEEHHVQSDGATTFWTVAFGFWSAAIEALVGVFYCLSLIGIPFGIKHLKLAPAIWGPHRFQVLSDVEYDEFLDARHSMSHRSEQDF